jgi:hypothetical protein
MAPTVPSIAAIIHCRNTAEEITSKKPENKLLNKATFVAGVIGVLVGAVAAYLTTQINPVERNWIDLQATNVNSKGKERPNIVYSTEALFGSDIALPEITSVSGQAKFIPQSGTDTFALGYVVKVSVGPLDMSKVPEKYKVERTVTVEGQTVTSPPIEGVVYTISPQFSLMDTDGFEFAKLEGEKHFLYSGMENRFQSIIKDHVSAEIARKISSISMQLVVQKCETCK